MFQKQITVCENVNYLAIAVTEPGDRRTSSGALVIGLSSYSTSVFSVRNPKKTTIKKLFSKIFLKFLLIEDKIKNLRYEKIKKTHPIILYYYSYLLYSINLSVMLFQFNSNILYNGIRNQGCNHNRISPR